MNEPCIRVWAYAVHSHPHAQTLRMLSPWVVHRVLKQLGSGSIAAGICTTVKDTSAQVNVASILSVEQRLLADELARLPRSKPGTADVDLAKMYDRLKAVPMRRNSRPVSPEFDQHHDVFMWCAFLFTYSCVPIRSAVYVRVLFFVLCYTTCVLLLPVQELVLTGRV
jgi:hypothetical protein